MRSLVEYLAKALVDDPSQVEVMDGGGDEHNRILKLKVAKSDLGKVIGKKGRTARALRTVLGAAAQKVNQRWALEIVEPPLPNANNGTPPAPPAAPPAQGA